MGMGVEERRGKRREKREERREGEKERVFRSLFPNFSVCRVNAYDTHTLTLTHTLSLSQLLRH
jgi:hypothetical protein